MSNKSIEEQSKSAERGEIREEFLKLYAVNARQIYGYIRTMVPVQEDVDDIFQETCVVLWRRFDEYEFGTNFYAWARQIAYFQIMSVRKRHACSRLQFSEVFLEAVAREVESRNEAREQHWQQLEHCLRKLREKDRQLILKRYEKKQTVKVLAAQIGRPVGAVYKSLVRIERALLQCVHGKSLTAGGDQA